AAAHPAVRALAAGGRGGGEPAPRRDPRGVAGGAGGESPGCPGAAPARPGRGLGGRPGRLRCPSGAPPGREGPTDGAKVQWRPRPACTPGRRWWGRAAAAEVVAERLCAAGVGGYWWDLHWDRARRKAGAPWFAPALDRVPAAPAAVPPADAEAARSQRAELRE